MAQDGTTPLGIDCNKHYKDIKFLLCSRCPPPDAWEWDDWIQHILMTILIRNTQPSAYDPRQAKLSTYVLMVAQSIKSKLQSQRKGKRPILINMSPEDLQELMDYMIVHDHLHRHYDSEWLDMNYNFEGPKP